ncbi:MAG TPA: hypothetical protein VGC41_01620, partial [Kofleriaceae bacterium]
MVVALASVMSFAVACSWGGSSDHSGGSPDAATAATCGDGVCAASEIHSCPADCGQQGSGSGSGSSTATCNNNGSCENGETAASCPADCGTGSGSAGSGAIDCT